MVAFFGKNTAVVPPSGPATIANAGQSSIQDANAMILSGGRPKRSGHVVTAHHESRTTGTPRVTRTRSRASRVVDEQHNRQRVRVCRRCHRVHRGHWMLPRRMRGAFTATRPLWSTSDGSHAVAPRLSRPADTDTATPEDTAFGKWTREREKCCCRLGGQHSQCSRPRPRPRPFACPRVRARRLQSPGRDEQSPPRWLREPLPPALLSW